MMLQGCVPTELGGLNIPISQSEIKFSHKYLVKTPPRLITLHFDTRLQLLHEHELMKASSEMEMASARAELAKKASEIARLEREKQPAIQASQASD